MTKILSLFLSFVLVFSSASLAVAQTADTAHATTTPTASTPTSSGSSFQLSVPLLQGRAAPFTGLLISEDSATQCIEDSASVARLTVDLAARSRELELSTTLRDQFISDQRDEVHRLNDRIQQLSQRSWWDENGNIFMLGLGLVLGIAAAALIAGLTH